MTLDLSWIDFLDKEARVKIDKQIAIKEQIDKLDFIKMKHCGSKDTIQGSEKTIKK